jgi:hypothetical protein
MTSETIKKRIQELCPDVMPMCERCENAVPITSDFCKDGLTHLIQQRRITLAVVLRAIGDKKLRKDDAWEIVCLWNLEHDNFDQQSDECKQFIGSLLGI